MCLRIWFIRAILALLSCLGPTASALDLWELPPVRYADTPATDPVAQLAADLAKGTRTVAGATPLERLRAILRLLDIPVESQLLVFSKTSKQIALIHPGHPRAIYFNENA